MCGGTNQKPLENIFLKAFYLSSGSFRKALEAGAINPCSKMASKARL
jgi:hypothetical protein